MYNIIKDISNLQKEDIYNLMLILLYVSSDNPKYSTLNELAYLLDKESFLNFIKYYEGQTLQIPTMEEINSSLRTLLLFQYYKVEKLDWNTAYKKAGFTDDESVSANRYLTKFIEHLENNEYKLGGIFK